jgi:2-polyprenyl-3-methyl-5-hydroxy-6-metoxy-1,4-benzoquinol methylase
MTATEQHWEKVYATKAPDQVSWYRPHLERSLQLIERAIGGQREASILDVGAGASTLVDDLLALGYQRITVLDISTTALQVARARLGASANRVEWVAANVTAPLCLPQRHYDVWHDRAVFHFLTTPKQRLAYVRNVGAAMKPGGHVIVSTFGPEGPTKCSGLEVVRYDAESLHQEFGASFHLVESLQEQHETPFGTTQQFLYCLCAITPAPEPPPSAERTLKNST